MYTYVHKLRNFFRFSRLLLTVFLCLTLQTCAFGDKWQIMTFTENLEQDLASFDQFCFLHDLSSSDVLWANNYTPDDLVPGTQIRLPVSRIDLLSLWQNRGAWQPKALVPKTSAALAERARTKPAAQPVQSESVKISPEQSKTAALPEPKPENAKAPVSSVSANTNANANSNQAKNPVTKTATTQTTKEAASTRETAADAIAKATAQSQQTPMPTSVSKPQVSLPTKQQIQADTNKTDPILFLDTPDNNSGAMRLVISGDTVAVVRLPQEAAPKKPTLADLNQTFGMPLDFDMLHPNPGSKPGDLLGDIDPTKTKMMWPVSGKVTSGFGKRGTRQHQGLDLPMPLGTEIHAAQDGTVILTGTNNTPGFRGYGNFALIDHGRSICTLYSHCNDVFVKRGQHVRRGQVIASVGGTGRVTTNHLHFEVRLNGKPVDPIPYLAKR